MRSLVSSPSRSKEKRSSECSGHVSSSSSLSSVGGLRGLEHILAIIVVLLAVCSVGLQQYAERVYAQDVALGTSDEARLAAEVADIEMDITRTYTARQIDASADEAGDGAVDSGGQVDPNTPNADGEFEVPPTEALLQTREVMLASKMFFPIPDDSWLEVRREMHSAVRSNPTLLHARAHAHRAYTRTRTCLSRASVGVGLELGRSICVTPLSPASLSCIRQRCSCTWRAACHRVPTRSQSAVSSGGSERTAAAVACSCRSASMATGSRSSARLAVARSSSRGRLPTRSRSLTRSMGYAFSPLSRGRRLLAPTAAVASCCRASRARRHCQSRKSRSVPASSSSSSIAALAPLI